MIRQCINACPLAHVQVDFLVDNLTFLVFHINKRPMLIRQQNLRLVQIGWNPLPLFSAFWWDAQLISCDMMYLCQTVFHTSLNMSWTVTWQKSSPPSEEKILQLYLSISCNFQQLWFSWQKPPPPPTKKFCNWIYPFHAISSNFGSVYRTPPSPGKIWD